VGRDSQVREPGAAWPREVTSAFACSQSHENIWQNCVSAEPRQQAVMAVASRSTATLAFDADDVQRKFA